MRSTSLSPRLDFSVMTVLVGRCDERLREPVGGFSGENDAEYDVWGEMWKLRGGSRCSKI